MLFANSSTDAEYDDRTVDGVSAELADEFRDRARQIHEHIKDCGPSLSDPSASYGPNP
jgi:hypothetical protein